MKTSFKKYYVEIQTNTFFFLYQKFFTRTFRGFAAYPFLFVRKKYFLNTSKKWQQRRQRILTHEQIHLHQQLEMLIIFWYLWNFCEYYYFRMYMGFDREQAYQATSTEQEAYQHMHDSEYVEKRKPFATFTHLWKKKTPPIRIWNEKEEKFEFH